MSWIPTADRVLIRYDEPGERVSAGGIILPGDATTDKNVRADVVAVGKDARGVKVGDRVLVSGYAGASVPNDELARLIREDDVLVVIGGVK